MTGARLMLEQFETGPGGPAAVISSDIAAETDLAYPAHNHAPSCDSAPDTAEIALMGDPPIRRAPEEEPAQTEAEALAEDLVRKCDLLARTIAAIETDRAASLDAAISDVATGIAAIGAELLSSVIDNGLAAEIASAIVELAARIPHAGAELHVAPDDREALTEAIAVHAPDTAITLIADPALTSGRARLIWPDGGAELDTADLTDRIAPLIAERLNGLNIRSVT